MRDDFTEEVKRTLAARAGNVCSNPDCQALTSGPQVDPTKALNVGVAAHIKAAAEGGKRYDARLTADERSHPDNGIWLCQTCAKLIDNDASRFPERLLRAWKEIAEDRALRSIGKTVSHDVTQPHQGAAVGPALAHKVRLEALSPDGTTFQLNNYGPAMLVGSVNPLDCGEVIVRWQPPRYLGPQSATILPFDVVSREDPSRVLPHGSVALAIKGITPDGETRTTGTRIVCIDPVDMSMWIGAGLVIYDDAAHTVRTEGFLYMQLIPNQTC